VQTCQALTWNGGVGTAGEVRLCPWRSGDCPGDEGTAEAACRTFGAEGQVRTAGFLARSEHPLLVAEEGGAVIGWIYGHQLLHPDGEATMLLYALDVIAAARRQGVGTELVEAFVAEARKSGCTEVWVLTDVANPAALATYRSAGGDRDPAGQVMFTWPLAPI
jgi:ribosomal protein S18 acetylase RimI-like enzyme